MDIRILHIDDEEDVLSQLKEVMDGVQLGDAILRIVDSCGFEEGMLKLKTNQYDLVILDLCVGNASDASDKVGSEIFEQIKERVFIPVIFFTGLPDYVRGLQSDIVRVASKQEGYDALTEQVRLVLETDFISIKNSVNDIIREGIRAYFWNFVHPNSALIHQIKEDEVSLNYLLLRRLAKTLSSETLKSSVNDPLLKKNLSHPMEFYVYPPVEGEFETGDIIKCKDTGETFAILTPSCDLVLRANGKRKAEKVLIVQGIELKKHPEYDRLQELKNQHAALLEQQAGLPNHRKAELSGQIAKVAAQITNTTGKIKDLMRPKDDRFFFLPGTPFLPDLLLDFQHKKTITYETLDNDYSMVATLDDPYSQSMLASFIRYYNRVGFPDLDVDYAFEKLI